MKRRKARLVSKPTRALGTWSALFGLGGDGVPAESRVDGGPGRANRGPESVRDRIKQFEVITILHATATGNHDPRGG